VVFEDGTGFTLHPRLGMGWAKRGRRFRIPTTSQHQARLNIFGWVAPLLGKTGLIRYPQGNREGFLLCLKQLYGSLRGYKIRVLVDGARWHKGEEVDIFLKHNRRLSMTYLPSYQPGLNVQERIWRRVRYESTTNHWFATLEETWIAVHKTVHSWIPAKIKRLCNVI
jgi:transposase